MSFVSISAFSQENNNKELNTEMINVVKAYNPEVSDAYKIKTTPDNKLKETEKQKLNYETHTTEVVSTFKPSKIGAKSQARKKTEKVYDNFARLGYGSYRTPMLELYMNNKAIKEQRYGVHAQHLSSEGGIDGVKFNNAFINSSVDGFYWKQFYNYQLKTNLKYHYQSMNWYGVPDVFINDETVSSLNVAQYYQTISADATLVYNGKKDDYFFKSTYLEAYRMWDRYGSGENRIKADAVFAFPVAKQEISIKAEVDFIDNSFEKDYNRVSEINNSYVNFGITPSYNFIVENAKLDVGIGFFYSADLNGDNNLFRIYPKINVSVNLADDLMIAYGGVDGEMRQNSLQSIVEHMPYISPTQDVGPTNMQYNFYAGLRGKLMSNLTYNTSVSYRKEYGALNFISNPAKAVTDWGGTSGLISDAKGWEAGNSFTAHSDTITTLKFKASLEYEAVKDLIIGADFMFNSFGSDGFEDVYNMPDIVISANAEYRFLEDFTVGTSMYFVSGRKYAEHVSRIQPYNTTDPLLNYATKTGGNLDSYFDLNFNAGYDITKQFSAFLKLNNVLGQNYELYRNLPVQGFQIMGGVGYKF